MKADERQRLPLPLTGARGLSPLVEHQQSQIPPMESGGENHDISKVTIKKKKT